MTDDAGDDTLFPVELPPALGLADITDLDYLSTGGRLRVRQQLDVLNNTHPLTGQRIHPSAERNRTAKSNPNDPYTCGSCIHRIHQFGGGGGSYPKCNAAGHRGLTHSAATDVRAWWPACPAYEPKDTVDA